MYCYLKCWVYCVEDEKVEASGWGRKKKRYKMKNNMRNKIKKKKGK